MIMIMITTTITTRITITITTMKIVMCLFLEEAVEILSGKF